MARTVSVIIPAYNAQATIARCLHALSQQSYPLSDVEVLVVDDGSSDGTVSRVKEMQQTGIIGDLHIVLLEQSHSGPAAARNLGAQTATGDYVLFTDSDCEPAPHWIEEMIAPFTTPTVAAVKGAYKTRQRELIARFAQAEFESRYQKLARAQSVDVVFSYSAAFRRSIFLKIGGFDRGFPTADNEDTDLSYRLATAGYTIIFNPAAIVYHTHPATIRAYLFKKHSRAYWRIVVYRRFPGKAMRDSYTPQSLKAQIGSIYLGMAGATLLTLSSRGTYLLALASMIFMITTIPFVRRLPPEDRPLRLAAPFFLFCRAVAMALGVVRALPRLIM